ncbi:MYG1 family protein [Photobacterium leiognathi]|uniref:MYG1 family protein n=1 Tax=Photobacterium leiognathi TaxID=553611 RepID=UPI002980E41F|nr:MYG1 family protein [Photobacterium leiognathi]
MIRLANVITHDGTFHSDELFACALLKRFYSSDLAITRTRDVDKLNIGLMDPNVFVIDVGGQYNFKMLNFDHHFKKHCKYWHNEKSLQMSSCGLVWTFLKKKGFLKKFNKSQLRSLEQRLIKRIDAHDTGTGKYGIWKPSIIFSGYNRSVNNDQQFKKALSVACDVLDNYIQFVISESRVESSFNKVSFKLIDKNILFVPERIDGLMKYVSKKTSAKVVIRPRLTEDNKELWVCESVFREKSEILLAPLELCGIDGELLKSITDIPGLTFCHSGGHLAICSDKESAILMAKLMVRSKSYSRIK